MIFAALCTSILSLLSTWMHHMKRPSCPSYQCFKTKDKLNVTAINYTLYYTCIKLLVNLTSGCKVQQMS